MRKVTSLVRHMPWLLILAACLGFIINLHPYELYLGVSLVFGMSIALMMLFFAGGWWGVVVAIPASLATVYLWGQPYSCLIFLLEAIVITMCCNSRYGEPLLRKGYIIIVDFLFWLMVGSPLYYFSHLYFIGLSHDDALSIAEKAMLNGVLNTLIAFSFYSSLSLLRNKRIQGKPTISIQALSLTTIYSLIVSISLFTTSHLYGNLILMQAKDLNGYFLDKADYIMDVLGPNSTYTTNTEITQYMKNLGSTFRWQTTDSPLHNISSEDNSIRVVQQNYNDSTNSTRVSLSASQLAQHPNSIKLFMPKKSKEVMLLKRYAKGYWQASIYRDNEFVTIMRSSEPEFSELSNFYKSMLDSIIYSLSAGIVLSTFASFALGREFLSVLRGNKIVSIDNHNSDNIFLCLSPIEEIQNLAIKVNERTTIIQDAKKEIEALNNIAQQQLSTAGEIQQCFLGSNRISKERPDVSLFMRPAYNAGGDWYDVFDLDCRTFLVVADVCDKGVGAALFMSVFRSLIRFSTESLCSQPSHDNVPLDEVITRVNNYMSVVHSEISMFATVFLACIDNKANRLDYILAGHEEPILLRPNGEVFRFKISGPAIGLFPFANYSIGSTHIDSGSILLSYTDGVVDARNTANEAFSHQRLMDLILNLKATESNLKAQMITDRLVEELDRHIDNGDQFDDITIAAAIL